METVKGRSCLCIRSVLIKNAHHKSLLGGKEEKKGSPLLCNTRDFREEASLWSSSELQYSHQWLCILSSLDITVPITQLKKSASSYRMPLFLKEYHKFTWNIEVGDNGVSLCNLGLSSVKFSSIMISFFPITGVLCFLMFAVTLVNSLDALSQIK